jgi:hypothetical protein
VRLDDDIRQAEIADHARAGARGERLRVIANDVVSKLMAAGYFRGDLRGARVVTFHVLADHLYGLQAVDIPDRLGKP